MKSIVNTQSVVAVIAAVSFVAPIAYAAEKTHTEKTMTTTTAGTAETTDNSAANSASAPTDGQITALMQAANKAEIEEAKMAKSKGVDSGVKDFANHMVTEHTKNEKESEGLVKKTGVKPDADFTTLTAMKKDAQGKATELKKLKGADFDRAYVANQVAMHEELLGKLNNELIPAAKDKQIKDYLENTKSHVEAHLALAKALQSKIGAQ